jgi:hypothetical protein
MIMMTGQTVNAQATGGQPTVSLAWAHIEISACRPCSALAGGFSFS